MRRLLGEIARVAPEPEEEAVPSPAGDPGIGISSIMMYMGDPTMVRMIRKQVYLEAAQDALLKRLAAARHVSEATIIRGSVARYAASIRPVSLDRAAWERQRRRIARSIAKGPLAGTRTWRREDLYADRLERFDR